MHKPLGGQPLLNLLNPCSRPRAVSDQDRVALNSMKFASVESAGAGMRTAGSPSGSNVHMGQPSGALVEASMDQFAIPLPPWAIRAGARQNIYFDPSQVGPGGAAGGVRGWALGPAGAAGSGENPERRARSGG